MNADQTAAVDVTLLVCTFNRRADLQEMLETALAQETDGSFTYEVLVVDNNSNDGTRSVVEDLIRNGHTNLRYLFEPRQGKGFALNTGLAAARGHIYTVADDDFILPGAWVRRIVEAFRQHPDASFVSGKVLPLWPAEVPAWAAGTEHWSALALADYGDQPFCADENRQVCLLACSFRRRDVDAVGGYRTALGVARDLIGGVEDLEILQRLWKSGRKGVYLPDISFQHKVPASRLTMEYHRRWHTGHGRFYARLRDEQFERSRARLFDVPLHVFRQAGGAALAWLKWRMRRRPREAFTEETKLRFLFGYLAERLQSPSSRE
jgi:glycosyltransferase involved in cell wall biosynthesis